ncbi:MAG: tRNA pseudouridine(55) synthase TruB [Oscillospiraceae bacterium]|nr:tRNA pseudouridine(55) synthase TruB [Oscillospiraceae bacterium]
MPNGILIIDKPADWTSMDVCAKVRGMLHERRVGHGGTLDPMATGVLPVFVGQATKAVEFAENSRKEYVAGLRLGLSTDTQDVTGNTLETRPVHVTASDVEAALERFTGDIQQIPPMYSALKVQGKKLYELARKGKEVERPPRPVTIYELELLARESDTDYKFRCLCSKGTYVRTLCHDIGQVLGCGGTLYALRRTRAGDFTEADAVSLDAVREQGAALLRPLDTLFRAYPEIRALSPAKERRIRCGNEIRWQVPDGVYRVYGQDGDFLCLSEARGGILKALKNFFTS